MAKQLCVIDATGMSEHIAARVQEEFPDFGTSFFIAEHVHPSLGSWWSVHRVDLPLRKDGKLQHWQHHRSSSEKTSIQDILRELEDGFVISSNTPELVAILQGAGIEYCFYKPPPPPRRGTTGPDSVEDLIGSPTLPTRFQGVG